MEDYSVSHDDKQVAFSLKDQNGVSHVWLSPTDHRSSPRELASAAGQDSPRFLPNGDLLLRSTEDGQNFLYRISQDGTQRRKITPDPILDLRSASSGRPLGGGINQAKQRKRLHTRTGDPPSRGRQRLPLTARHRLPG